MSSLEKLGIIGFFNEISGIRSYSPLECEKIEFFKPLTIIWGHNGAGKTVLFKYENRQSSSV
jgi:predicted ATPase